MYVCINTHTHNHENLIHYTEQRIKQQKKKNRNYAHTKQNTYVAEYILYCVSFEKYMLDYMSTGLCVYYICD